MTASPTTTRGQQRALDQGGPARELRLALVCYGGVSLAIYMHGVTREIHSLVRASAALDADPDRADNPFGPDQTERAYWQALRDLRQRDGGVRTSVVVDVISGTSAGGINGVVLAKAIARNQSQAKLRDVWFQRADFDRLLRLPSLLPPPARRLHLLPSRPLLGLRLALSTVWLQPPLHGGRMSQWLYQALGGMEDEPGWDSLIPRDGSLELFVTATDLAGFHRFLTIRGTDIQDRDYRRVLRFARGPDGDDFGGDASVALAFAARATASFPGAFPPVTFAGLHREVDAPGEPEAIAARFFPSRPGESANDTYFVDGGVLDNFPFDHAVRAIVAKPAARQVSRLLLYIEPDPSTPAQPGARPAARVQAPPPPWLATIWRCLSSIPAHQPILDALADLEDFNRRVRLVSDITKENFPLVENLLEDDIERIQARAPTLDEARELRDRMQELARQRAGETYTTYLLLKLDDAATYLATVVAGALAYPPESSQASFVQEALRHWIADQPEGERRGLLERFDRGYRERRLRYIVDGVNDRYSRHPEERALLDTVKEALYRLLTQLWKATSPEALREQLGDVPRDLFPAISAATPEPELPDPAAFARDHDRELRALVERVGALLGPHFTDSGAALWDRFLEVTRGHPELQAVLLVRYLGFPLWDTMIFPVLALTQVNQFSQIGVRRISPDDARRIPTDERGPLRGNALHHFGAFERRADREHDYLCGRLDGLERLLALLGLPAEEDRWREGLRAVWEAERPLFDQDPKLAALVEAKLGDRRPAPAPAAAAST